MKGQTQALTAVMITTVTVGAVAVAYSWGTPLLEKRQSQAELSQTEQKIINLKEKIVSTSRGGEGTTSEISMEIDSGRIEINPDEDIIDIYTTTPESPYPNAWTPVENMGSRQNLSFGEGGDYAEKGSNMPGAVAVKGSPGSSSGVLQYRIEFRNMYTESSGEARLEKINIQVPDGSPERTSGDFKLLITNVGTTSSNVEVATGEKIPRTEKNVEVRVQR